MYTHTESILLNGSGSKDKKHKNAKKIEMC